MKILVLSDSHSSLRFMRQCIAKFQPEQVIHLGDHYDDGQVLVQENPNIRFHQVPGNCDYFRCLPDLPKILCYDIGGVRFYMTHGHLHGVKSGMGHLLSEARKAEAQVVLFGHTHSPVCFCEGGMYIMNPGSCGSGGGSAGIVQIECGAVAECRLVTQEELISS